MDRKPNTTKEGNAWPDVTKMEVWQKGREIPGYAADVWRRDKCGKIIKWDEYGNKQSNVGWEIDHIKPVSNKGTDDINNLQPLNWVHNTAKGESITWSCPRNR